MRKVRCLARPRADGIRKAQSSGVCPGQPKQPPLRWERAHNAMQEEANKLPSRQCARRVPAGRGASPLTSTVQRASLMLHN